MRSKKASTTDDEKGIVDEYAGKILAVDTVWAWSYMIFPKAKER
jgi:hypothetical protein